MPECHFYGHSYVGTSNCVYCNIPHPTRGDAAHMTCGPCGHPMDWHGKRDNGACNGAYLIGLTSVACKCELKG